MSEVCKLLGIQKTSTAIYHPQSNGLTERFNRTLLSMLRAYVFDYQTEWDKWLPALLFAYRTAVQESLNKTPFELLFGKGPRTPADVNLLPPFHHPYPALTGEKLQDFRERAHGQLKRAQKRQKLYYDSRRNICSPWHPGDPVLLKLGKTPRGKSTKLCQRYEPAEYRLIELRKQTAIIEDLSTGKLRKVPYDRLKPYHRRIDDPSVHESPQSEIDTLSEEESSSGEEDDMVVIELDPREPQEVPRHPPEPQLMNEPPPPAELNFPQPAVEQEANQELVEPNRMRPARVVRPPRRYAQDYVACCKSIKADQRCVSCWRLLESFV